MRARTKKKFGQRAKQKNSQSQQNARHCVTAVTAVSLEACHI
jgi:hypothetical protein